MQHTLKIDEKWLPRIMDGQKTSEIRLNDRDYQKGDVITFQPVNDESQKIMMFTSKRPVYEITHVLNSNQFPEALKPGYCVLSIQPLK